MRWVVWATCTWAMYMLFSNYSTHELAHTLFILILKYHSLNWKHPLTVLLCQFFFRSFVSSFVRSVLACSTFAHNSSPCVSIGIQSVETCDRDLCGIRQIESTHYFKCLPLVHCTIILIATIIVGLFSLDSSGDDQTSSNVATITIVCVSHNVWCSPKW